MPACPACLALLPALPALPTCLPACLQEDDVLQFVGLCSPTDSILIAASDGQAQHFLVSKMRRMGRTAAGVKVRTACAACSAARAGQGSQLGAPCWHPSPSLPLKLLDTLLPHLLPPCRSLSLVPADNEAV